MSKFNTSQKKTCGSIIPLGSADPALWKKTRHENAGKEDAFRADRVAMTAGWSPPPPLPTGVHSEGPRPIPRGRARLGRSPAANAAAEGRLFGSRCRQAPAMARTGSSTSPSSEPGKNTRACGHTWAQPARTHTCAGKRAQCRHTLTQFQDTHVHQAIA